MNKRIKAALNAHADVCNRLILPRRGCHAGDGIHVIIPANFLAIVAANEDVPGCNYYARDGAGALRLDDRVQNLILNLDVQTLPAQFRTAATNLIARLNAWQPADEDPEEPPS